VCIQCNQCALVCPHAAIRAKVYDEAALQSRPSTFKATAYRGNEYKGKQFTIQVAPEDCTGCNLCVNVCPPRTGRTPSTRPINMRPQAPLREAERRELRLLPRPARDGPDGVARLDHKGSQFLEPLFEYSGACAGCGETPYLKLLTQLFGDRLMMANATGCSSIYGGNLPTTPYTTNRDGRGPAWANSLFEDNAEFGFGFRLGARRARGLPRAAWSRTWRLGSATTWSPSCSRPIKGAKRASRRSARVSRRCGTRCAARRTRRPCGSRAWPTTS
jgi:pyruvate-ferredoxin/flavodoxin oxidoreductase